LRRIGQPSRNRRVALTDAARQLFDGGRQGISRTAEDDRNGRGRGFGRECRRYEVWRDDDGHPAANQIGRQFRQPIILTVRPPIFDRNVLALDKTGFSKRAPWSENSTPDQAGIAPTQSILSDSSSTTVG
jgi:hypothetical protein